MRLSALVGLLSAAAILWSAGSPAAEEGLTKRDARGPVTVIVTLTAPPEVGTPVKAKVVLDTHSVPLDSIKLEEAVVLRADGADLAPTAVEEAAGGGHHRSAVLIFPPPARAGEVRIVVKDVGGVAERSFAWVLPAR